MVTFLEQIAVSREIKKKCEQRPEMWADKKHRGIGMSLVSANEAPGPKHDREELC